MCHGYVTDSVKTAGQHICLKTVRKCEIPYKVCHYTSEKTLTYYFVPWENDKFWDNFRLYIYYTLFLSQNRFWHYM